MVGCTKAPSPAPAPPGAGLPTSDVIKTILDRKGDLARCVALQRAQQPGTSGNLVMHWTILTDGSPTDIGAASEEWRDSPFEKCVTALIASMRFPTHERQGPPITFPFKF